MQTILLAAGQSSRLNPIEDKNLLHFHGTPLIQHRVKQLQTAGLNDFIIVGSQNNLKKLKGLFKDHSNIKVVEQKNLEGGMAAGILAGSEAVDQNQVSIMSANDIFDPNEFKTIINTAKESESGLIVGKKVDTYFPGGYISMNEKGFMTDIIEKPGAGNEPSNLVNIVFHIYNDFPKLLSHLKKTDANADGRYEKALDNYIKESGAQMKVHEYDGIWQPIKYPWHILEAMNHLLSLQESTIHPSAEIAKSAIIRGNVIIDEGARILDHSVIQGPAYIGKNCIIANGSLVRQSMIGENCVVGFSTEVARSYLNHDIWMHTNYIGDSIVDRNVSFGAGTVLGNLRFDEEEIKVKIKEERMPIGTNKFGAIIGSGVRFGVNASTSPGVKIGQNTFVGAGVLVEKDIEKGKMTLLDQKLKIVDNKKTVDVKKRH